MPAKHETTFVPNPVQKNFIESRARADLFSSRMGEGKSTALAWSALYHTRHNPGARWALIRDTFENIVGTTQKTFFQWFPPGIFGEYHHTRKTFTWANGIASGEVEFLGMDDPTDASKLMSREFAGFGIDEPAPAVGSAGVDEMIFDIAMSRLRMPNMKWYCAKLAENNPDEAHWTYKRFVTPGEPDFSIWQPRLPENSLHLPADYYAQLRKLWGHRPDLIRRFVDGEFGFQSIGRAVTPQWNDQLHLAIGLIPVPRLDLHIGWDFGHNPTCIISQITPLGNWNILDAVVGDGIGVEELIENAVIPLLRDRYRGHNLRHIGDPAGTTRDQSSTMRSAVRSIKKMIGGTWRSGPVKPHDRIEPLRAVLIRTVGGKGLVRVDRERAAPVWHALRGGWHFHVSRTGITSGLANKDIHSHPGDAVAYLASILYPMGRVMPASDVSKLAGPTTHGYFRGQSTGVTRTADALNRIGKPVSPGQVMPNHGDRLK